MKKALTSVLTLISSMAILSGTALTVSAGVVVAQDGYTLLLDDGTTITQEEFWEKTGVDRTLQRGDVVQINGEFVTLPIECFPRSIHYTGDITMEYRGIIEDVYADDIKKLTVTESFENGYVKFVDENGMTCSWWSDAAKWQTYDIYHGHRNHFTTNEGYHPFDYQVGDVVECAMRSDGTSVILPIEPAPGGSTVNNTISVDDVPGTVVYAANENMLLFGNSDYAMTQESFRKYSGEDRTLEYGDVIAITYFNVDPNITYPHFVNLDVRTVMKYLGKAETYYKDSTEELTITGISKGNEMTTSSIITFENTDGTAYRWRTDKEQWDSTLIPEGFTPSAYQIGDVVSCAVDAAKNEVILPLTPAPEHTPIKGDVDCNGTVNIMDVILLNRNLMVGAEISEQGMKNALTNTTGIALQSDDTQRQPDAVDALNILKYIVRLIPEL